MRKILKLAPVFKQIIWGGSRMRDVFGYDIPGDNTGECWAVSAHRNGDCPVLGGADGETLSGLWTNSPELFGRSDSAKGAAGDSDTQPGVFPLLTKIIDARQNLSIQVHPDDAYARVHENGSLGKTECWYILDCDPDATIIIGHNAKDKAELEDMIRNGRWSEFLREIPIAKGDFLQIYPGTVHAIKGGTMLLETQQNSDITYRVYDYDRLQNGKPRQLHVQQSIDVITVPFAGSMAKEKGEALVKVDTSDSNGTAYRSMCTPLIKCDYYQVWKLDIDGEVTYLQDRPFMICSVIEGEGAIFAGSRDGDPDAEATKVRKGDHFILTAGCGAVEFSGNMKLICSAE